MTAPDTAAKAGVVGRGRWGVAILLSWHRLLPSSGSRVGQLEPRCLGRVLLDLGLELGPEGATLHTLDCSPRHACCRCGAPHAHPRGGHSLAHLCPSLPLHPRARAHTREHHCLPPFSAPRAAHPA